jgi:cell division protein FtsB
MRLVTVVLVLLLALIQYPLWWGHGGWLRVHELQGQLAQQTQKNADLKLRNERVQFVAPNSAAPVNSANAPGANASTRGQVSAAPLRVVPNPVSRSKEERRAFEKKATKDKEDAAKKKQAAE